MDNRDFSNLGEQIRDSVQSAIDSMDFKQLNRTISDTVNCALDEARSQMIKGMEGARRRNTEHETGADRGNRRVYENNRHMGDDRSFEARHGFKPGQAFVKESKKEKTAVPGYRAFQTSDTVKNRTEVIRNDKDTKKVSAVRWNQPGRVAGILYTVFGSIGLGIVVILFLLIWLLAIVIRPFWGAVLGASVFLLILGGVFGTVLGIGISMRGRFKRAGIYLKQAGSKLYCGIEELAKSIGKSKNFVIKDIQKMIEKGILPEAHIDEQKTCLILDNETYKQYLITQQALKQREHENTLIEEQRKREQSEKEAFDREKEETQKAALPEGMEQMMAQGRNYLRILREANEAIPGEVISAKITRLETVIRRIFESVERHPEQMEEMGRFMDYYLPTTAKLVEAYRDFDRVEIEGENIAAAKHEIEETLDTINRAFERLLDDLYQDAALDVSTDASVLQTMLKKDGFAESDFSRRNKE